MNREQQIEEMANDLKDCYETSDIYGNNPDYQETAINLYDLGYRKMDEVTLKLDLGDRTPEEIKQIAEMFNGEIKKQVAKEILDLIDKNTFNIGKELYLQSIDDDSEAISVYGLKYDISKKYGVEVDE